MTNNSGFRPHDLKVLVLMDDVQETTKGGIILTAKIVERDGFKQQYGTLVAVGKNAFKEWNGDHPQVGDRVCIGSYTGRIIEGRDDKQYRLLNDEDIWSSIDF